MCRFRKDTGELVIDVVLTMEDAVAQADESNEPCKGLPIALNEELIPLLHPCKSPTGFVEVGVSLRITETNELMTFRPREECFPRHSGNPGLVQ